MWRSEVNYNNYLKIIDIRIKGREILMGIRRWLSGVIKSNESCGLAEGIWYRRRGRTTSSDRYYTRFSLFRGPIIIRCFTMLIDRRHNYAAELAALRMPDAQLMPRHRQIIGHRVFFSRLIPFLPVRRLALLPRQTENIVPFASPTNSTIFLLEHTLTVNCQIYQKYQKF